MVSARPTVLRRQARLLPWTSVLSFLLLVALASPSLSQAGEAEVELTPEEVQQLMQEHLASFGWEAGPDVFPLGSRADIQLSEEYSFLDASETRNLMEFYENIPSDTELGLVARGDDLGGWFVVFEFDDIGYVEDDDKDEIDAEELLETFHTGSEQMNRERAKRGIPALDVVGWRTPPQYNEQTQNLEWCLHLESDGSPVFNHNIRLLGRHGVMKVTLVSSNDQLDAGLAETRTLLEGFEYRDGQKYSQIEPGDKRAQYGLAALVAGGAVAAIATKGKIFTKLLKPLIIGVLALAAFFARFYRKIFPKRDDGFPDRSE